MYQYFVTGTVVVSVVGLVAVDDTTIGSNVAVPIVAVLTDVVVANAVVVAYVDVAVVVADIAVAEVIAVATFLMLLLL